MLRMNRCRTACLVPSHQGPPARRRQAARRRRGRRVDDRDVAHHALFRSDQNRQSVRPDHAIDRTACCAKTGSAAKISRRPFPKNPRTRSRRFWPASGTISAASAPSSPISITSGIYDIDHPEKSRVEIPQRTHELFAQLKNDGKPALIFASHLGNWELPALAAVAHGLDAAILFRRPNIAVRRPRHRANPRGQDGHADPGRPRRAAEAGARPCKRASTSPCWSTSISPTASRSPSSAARPRPIRCWRGCCGRSTARSMARASSACPATASAPNCRKKSSRCATQPGKIDIQGTMQAVTSVVEGWIREYPDQWLWLHRRWR